MIHRTTIIQRQELEMHGVLVMECLAQIMITQLRNMFVECSDKIDELEKLIKKINHQDVTNEQ
jgi:hypothetical protein